MFNFGTQPAQPGSLNLSATGAPVAAQQSFGFAQPAMQPNPMMQGMMGGMGVTPQQQQIMQQHQQTNKQNMPGAMNVVQQQQPVVQALPLE